VEAYKPASPIDMLNAARIIPASLALYWYYREISGENCQIRTKPDSLGENPTSTGLEWLACYHNGMVPKAAPHVHA
jgi:hypothetical protein